MADDQFDPKKEGQRIARNYLSALGWSREWRRTVTREIRSHWTREVMEEKFRRADSMEEQAEAALSSEFEKWRRDQSSDSKEVLIAIYDVLKNRHDLGFFGKRIVGHIKNMLFL